MATVDGIISTLKTKANLANVVGMAKFGMTAENRLGISIPVLRKMGKEIVKDHQLALELWKTGFPEAQILSALIAEPGKLTEQQMEDWVKDINSWDTCDQVCMNLFEKTPLARKKIFEWSEREEEFVKRTAFSMIACIAWHHKKLEDKKLIEFFPLIKRESIDERNFVKKALMSDTLRSSFLASIKKGINLSGKNWATKM